MEMFQFLIFWGFLKEWMEKNITIFEVMEKTGLVDGSPTITF